MAVKAFLLHGAVMPVRSATMAVVMSRMAESMGIAAEILRTGSFHMIHQAAEQRV